MAFAILREELGCSVCLNVFTDPVTLRCGHNFCWVCIDRALGSQEGVGVYSCPECREEFEERPDPARNITLRNIIERCVSSMPDERAEGVFCAYCVHAPVSAVKSCLHCEASMCEEHLIVHNRSPEHVLSEPSNALQSRKCSVHKKILEYYCTQDASCICVTCCLAGEHKGHKVEQLMEASNKKKETLKLILTNLLAKRADIELKVQYLQERRSKVQKRAAGLTETVSALFRDLRRQLEDLEKKLLSVISEDEEQASTTISDLIHQMDLKKDEVSRKMSHLEKVCTTTDPLLVLQEQESGQKDFCDTENKVIEERRVFDVKVQSIKVLDEDVLWVTLRTGLADIVSRVELGTVEKEKASDVVLDDSTAFQSLNLLDGYKTVSWSGDRHYRPKLPETFDAYPQVLSTKAFSSGNHYVEWEVGDSPGKWSVGLCYPSMTRKGDGSCLGFNPQSWCLQMFGQHCAVRNNSKKVILHHVPNSKRFLMYLEYEAGRLSFYELCDPIRYLHTFHTTFSEPLHAACYAYKTNRITFK
ncbi:E3 ubiquitin-protein ligase TRIM11-like [Anomaloglossus baeobatrachus]|uniref:E3 ubiquitin-protein ligase TRIM11-like n=1 Tax=Anomaloglossus baeobatrachus TaxID=238106 RepID=UPI003F4FF805